MKRAEHETEVELFGRESAANSHLQVQKYQGLLLMQKRARD